MFTRLPVMLVFGLGLKGQVLGLGLHLSRIFALLSELPQ